MTSGVQERVNAALLSRAGRVERVVAVARVALASVSFVAVWLDPSTPARYTEEAYAVLGFYLAYAVAALGLLWTTRVVLFSSTVWAHCLDLAVYSILIYLTEGPTSPFFAYVVFAIIAATLRWRSRGTMLTAVVVIVMFGSIGAYVSLVLGDPAFELNRFMIRSVYLAVVASLLGYAAHYQQAVDQEMARLAAWPRSATGSLVDAIGEIQREASAILKAARIVLVWEEADEPWLYVSSWEHGSTQTLRLPPLDDGEIVAAPLLDKSFMCTDLGRASQTVITLGPDGPEQWHGTAIAPALGDTLRFQSVMSWPLRGDTFTGHLFVPDKPNMIVDDLTLGEIVATLASSRIDQCYLTQRLAQSAALEERYRVGRDLHDGLLQSLSAIGLQLSVVSEFISDRAARERLRDLQEALESEQRDLRVFIGELNVASRGTSRQRFDLGVATRELCARVERVWLVRVELSCQGRFTGPSALGLNAYRALHEALVNAARHSGASTIAVSLACHPDRIDVRVADDGRGFESHGRWNLTELEGINDGPVALRERIARLQGALVIESTDHGAAVHFTIPVPPAS